MELNNLEKEKDFLRIFVDFTNLLKVFEAHLFFLQEVHSSTKEFDDILSDYAILKDFNILLKSKEEICLPATSHFIKFSDKAIFGSIELSLLNFKKKDLSFEKFYEDLFIQVHFYFSEHASLKN